MTEVSEIICKIEEVSWWRSPEWWAILVALALGIIGIFQNQIRKLFWKPKLKVQFRLSPPDSHFTDIRNPITREFMYKTCYLKARVINDGNYQLEDTEGMVVELSKKAPNGQYKKIEDFLPLNLKWSISHEITKIKIQPKLFKFLDFGHVSEVQYEHIDKFGLTSKNKVVLVLDTEMAPNTGSHLIFPGEYRIKIIFAANNLKPVEKIYSLALADEWTDNQSEMLSNNIAINEISSME